MTHEYDDIIHLPHPVSAKHPQMSMRDRAAQFSPFAALNGHSDAIRETARETEDFIAPDESAQRELDQKMAYLLAHISEHPNVTITYFAPDKRKEGGSYQTMEKRLAKYDEYRQEIQMEDGTRIPIKSIVNIEGITL
ncbi:MAG: hypothetical protein J6T28_05895 [Paludibacteraceae bacterium]|nr:hypothetical protein [Paludibacteraceae bacterium]